MDHLTPQAEGRLVDRLISLKLTENQFNQLAREINWFPKNVFSKHFTNEQRTDVLVSRANQKGNYHLIERMFLPSTQLIIATSVDTYSAFDFRRLYQELLKALETIKLIEEEEEGFLNGNLVKHIEFKVKLRYKAKF